MIAAEIPVAIANGSNGVSSPVGLLAVDSLFDSACASASALESPANPLFGFVRLAAATLPCRTSFVSVTLSSAFVGESVTDVLLSEISYPLFCPLVTTLPFLSTSAKYSVIVCGAASL